LHLKKTSYNNPHGLADKANHSCAYDQALLSSYAMRNFPLIRRIVATQSYTTTTYLPMRRFMFRYPDVDTPPHHEGKELPFDAEFGVKFVQYPMTWHNSNRLLTVPGFTGVKTGITPTAGSCLSVWFENSDCKLITVVLGSRNIEYRWKDARRLTLWAAATLIH
jgi:D-alanyl-D-alanine carboxypeptidase